MPRLKLNRLAHASIDLSNRIVTLGSTTNNPHAFRKLRELAKTQRKLNHKMDGIVRGREQKK